MFTKKKKEKKGRVLVWFGAVFTFVQELEGVIVCCTLKFAQSDVLDVTLAG